MPPPSGKPQFLGVGVKLVHQNLEQRVWRRKVMFLATQDRVLLLSSYWELFLVHTLCEGKNFINIPFFASPKKSHLSHPCPAEGQCQQSVIIHILTML
jgi:hypothetical protein